MENPSPAAPVAVVRSPDLAAQLQRLAAAVGVPLSVVATMSELPRPWTGRGGVLVDEHAAAELVGGRSDLRVRRLLVTDRAPSPELWRLALTIRAEHVVSLPGDDDVVLEWLVDVADVRRRTARTIGIIGARGGVGASTVAVALARVAGRAGEETVLIDLDPLGGGIELLVGCEDVPGLRWPDVASTRGRISPTALRDALPADDSVSVLSWTSGGGSDVGPAAVRGVLDAAARAADLVVVDLPRHVDAAAQAALGRLDALLLVCGVDVRSAAAAAQLVASTRAHCDDVRLVVRASSLASVAADEVADVLGIRLAGRMPAIRGLDRAIDEGLGPPMGGRPGRALRLIHAAVAVAGPLP